MIFDEYEAANPTEPEDRPELPDASEPSNALEALEALEADTWDQTAVVQPPRSSSTLVDMSGPKKRVAHENASRHTNSQPVFRQSQNHVQSAMQVSRARSSIKFTC